MAKVHHFPAVVFSSVSREAKEFSVLSPRARWSWIVTTTSCVWSVDITVRTVGDLSQKPESYGWKIVIY